MSSYHGVRWRKCGLAAAEVVDYKAFSLEILVLVEVFSGSTSKSSLFLSSIQILASTKNLGNLYSAKFASPNVSNLSLSLTVPS